MKKILLAVDFSESCTNAIRYVNELVHNKDITVDMVNVYSVPIPTITTITPDIAESVLRDCKDSSQKILEELMNLIDLKNRGSMHAVYGIYPSSDIIDVARTINADLIVMALRQKYSLIDRFIGTVTANTISKSPIPVLAIPNGASFEKSCSVLFPTEERYTSKMKESFVTEINNLINYCKLYPESTIYLVHIDEGNGIDIRFKYPDYSNVRFIASNAASVEEGVKNTIDNYSIDLIAIHKKSRTFWERLYHSSLTRKLLFRARLPLLIFTDN